MNLNALRGFTEIVYRGSLTAAADALNISEPALSRQISTLEHDIGLTLFSRDKRQLIVTEEGAAFLTEAQSILETVAQVPEVVKGIKSKYQRRIRLVSMPRLAYAITAPALAAFRKVEPDTMIAADVQPRRFLERWIAVKNFDIGIGSLPAHHMSIETETILSLGAVAVLHPSHPLAKADRIKLEDLSNEPLVANTTGTLIRHQVEQMFERADLPMNPVIEVSQVQLNCGLVAQGVGYTITDPMVADIFGDQVSTVPIYPRFSMEFGLLWPRGKDVSPSTRQLGSLIRSQARAFADRITAK